jgi:FixJ family two-component response regulator
MPPARKTIAVIDDDDSVRRALERQIRAAGYLCETFASAEDFLMVVAICRASCVLSDVMLDGLSGLELALHPKVLDRNLPVLLMTGSTDSVIEVTAREVAAAFLRKPILSEKLLETIVDTIGPPIADGEP